MISLKKLWVLPLAVMMLIAITLYPALSLFAQGAAEGDPTTKKSETWRQPNEEDRGNVLEALSGGESDDEYPGVPEEMVEAKARANQ